MSQQSLAASFLDIEVGTKVRMWMSVRFRLVTRVAPLNDPDLGPGLVAAGAVGRTAKAGVAGV